MFNINGLEILLIAVLFLLLFGPDRLPSVVVDIMNVVRQLRAAAEAATDDLTREFQAAARDVREVQRTVEEAGAGARRVIEETGADARRVMDEAAAGPQIAPPSMLEAAERAEEADRAAAGPTPGGVPAGEPSDDDGQAPSVVGEGRA